MCIIVDANVISQFNNESSEAAQAVLLWIAKRGRMVYNQELLDEYKANFQFLKAVLEFSRSGKAALVAGSGADLGNLKDECKSKYFHILHLAKTTSASVLFSLDQKLHTDFKNNSVVGRHDRIVYQTERHKDQLFQRACPS
jgi:predicted nucleic acid-binding protein